MVDTELKNIALLIDADNTSPKGIDPVLTVMAKLGQVNIRRAYGNFAKSNLANWEKITNDFGISPQQHFDVSKGKNATDMAMTIDAIDLLYQRKVDGFGIMSSDGDFTPLVTRLRQEGVIVYGFGEKKTPEPFQAVCTRFLFIDDLIASTTQSDGPKKRGDKNELKKLDALVNAAHAEAKKDENGFARLSQIGQIAGNRSSFDVRNYGFKNLRELFEAMENFALEKREGNQIYVKRLR